MMKITMYVDYIRTQIIWCWYWLIIREILLLWQLVPMVTNLLLIFLWNRGTRILIIKIIRYIVNIIKNIASHLFFIFSTIKYFASNSFLVFYTQELKELLINRRAGKSTKKRTRTNINRLISFALLLKWQSRTVFFITIYFWNFFEFLMVEFAMVNVVHTLLSRQICCKWIRWYWCLPTRH